MISIGILPGSGARGIRRSAGRSRENPPSGSRRAASPQRLLPEPFLPVLGELIRVGFGHRDQGADVLDGRRLLFQVDLVKEMFDRSMAPFIDLLGKEELDGAAAQGGQWGGE